ncbi:MAG TPA: ATPase domain-containing protein [Gammaproteobacteria bacterium]
MSGMAERAAIGISGLDEILGGGLVPKRSYLIRGGPGRGKTTLGLQFLAAAGSGETALFIGFQESDEQLQANAGALGIDVSRVDFLSLAPDEQFFTQQQGYDVFSAADVEQQPVAESVMQAVKRLRPARVFVDSLTQLRFLSADIYQYRKQVLSFLRYLTKAGATVLFSSENSADLPDDDLQFMADGVVSFDADASGPTVRVTKFRGSDFRRGAHQMRVRAGGIVVFPRPLAPVSKLTDEERFQWKSGVVRLDAMLNGGLEAGTVSLITGPAGIGKSTLASLFATEAARQGRRAAIYLFEEEIATFLRRSKSLGIGVESPYRDGSLFIEQVEPTRYLADEFTTKVRRHVEEEEVELVVIDSTAGFELTLEGEDIRTRLHAFAKSLARMGVSVLLINEVESLMGEFKVSERGISYLSDNVIFLRYLETDGELRKTVGVLKKRLSNFDNRMHPFRLGSGGALLVDDPLQGVQGVLSAGPVLVDETVE